MSDLLFVARAGRVVAACVRGIPMEGDVEYLRRRAQQEREVALKAAHPKAREVHIELAERFEEFAQAAIDRDYRLGLDLFNA